MPNPIDSVVVVLEIIARLKHHSIVVVIMQVHIVYTYVAAKFEHKHVVVVLAAVNFGVALAITIDFEPIHFNIMITS